MAMMDRIFRLMAEKKASDVFVSVGAPLSIKINGVTSPVNSQILDSSNITALLKEVLSTEQLQEFERDWELNTAINLPELGSFRISVMRQKASPAFVVRFIPSDIPALRSLNLPFILSTIIQAQRGLILIAGATGSGKTTTVASMVDHRSATMSGHILTLEDPIEFVFKNRLSIVNQREIGTDTKDLHEALRNGLRQAPDCIFIGEIRDQETMAAALAYAQTGHLCIATLHANNSYHALSRALGFFPVGNRNGISSDLSVALRAVVSQRLVKKTNGERVPAVEVLLNTPYIAELMEKGDFSAIKEAIENSMAQGSQTFEQSLFQLMQKGVISEEEALAHADSQTNLQWIIKNAKNPATAESNNGEPATATPANKRPSKDIPGAPTTPLTTVPGATFIELAVNMG